MKVLIADDDKLFRELVYNILADAGYEVISEENGLLAWQRIQNETPDILVTDINMPEMDGFELVSKIRQDSNLSKMPILMLTIRELTEDYVHGYEYGADDYLTKPFNMDIFIARIKVLERRILKQN